MQKKVVKVILICFIMSFSVLNGASVFAARKPFKIVKLNFKTATPLYKGATTGGVAGSKFSSRKWGVLETDYASEKLWSDNVTFKYFALFKDMKAKEYVMLADEIEYVNVPKDKRLKSYLYIHPMAMLRYGKIERFRVELWHEGVMVDKNSWPDKGKTNWWLKVKGIKGKLIAKLYTPFAAAPSNECQIKMKV